MEIEHNADELIAKLEAIDLDAATERGVKKTVEDFRDLVLRKIDEEGLHGISTPGNRGPGPRLASEHAWVIKQNGDKSYVIQPHEEVEERAMYLEFGTDDHEAENTTDGTRYKFQGPNGNGFIYPKAVSGVEEYGFWRSAVQEFRAKERFKENVEDEVEKELNLSD